MTAEQKGQTVSLFNEEGEELFVISAPYMYDAIGAESDEIELVLTGENTLLVLPNEEWLNDTSRVYPVTIDPTYTSSQVTADIKDTYVHEGDSAGDHYHETKMYVGNRNSQKHYAYVKVPLDDLPDGIIAFNSASLKLYLPDVTSSWFPFLLRASNQAWASDTISWNNRPNLYPDIDSSGWSTTAGVVSNADGSQTTTFNVLPFVSNIYRSSSLSNYGFRISYSNEAEDDYNSFYTSEYGTQSRRPQITVNYTAGGAGGNTIADGVYYITNKATGKYMTVNNDLYKITPVYQCTLYSSTAAETSRARQMWKVKYLGNGYYSIRPLHELFYGLWRSDASSNELMIYNIGTTDTVSGVFSNAQWSITGSSGNYAIRKHGDTAKTLYLPTSPGQNEPVKCGTGANNDYSKWNFTPVSAPPQGAYLCEYNSSASAYRVVTNPTRYVAPGETRSLEDMKLRAIAYSLNTISQTFTCASNNTSVATVNAYGSVTGVSPGTAVITGTSASGNTTHFTVNVTEIANGTYFLKNKETGRYADIENGTMSGGTQIEQQDFDGDNAQRWIFTHLGDGYYSIKSANSSSVFYMGVSGDSAGNDVPVVLRAASLTDGAKWKISKTSSGAYKITAKTGEANDRVLAVGAYVLNTNGIDIEQRDFVNDTNYKDEWFLQRPENPELHIFMECKVPTGNFSIQCVGEKATGTTWYPLIQASANAWNNSGAGTSIVVDTSSSPYTCEVNSYVEKWYGLTTSYFPDGSTTSATIKINCRTCASDTNSRKSTITHEIGHLLGLEDDPPVPEDQSLMNHGRNRSTVYEPQEYDVVNVNYIYSLN